MGTDFHHLLASALRMPSGLTYVELTQRIVRLVDAARRFREGGDRGELLAAFEELGRPAS